MTELSSFNPTGRFSGLESLYSKFRPDYPADAVEFIVRHTGLTPGKTLVDIGCGTGISSRLFAGRGLRVIGIEPNANMLRQARAETLPERWPTVEYREGKAEATGLPDGFADALLAAQAFHWFDKETAFAEFERLVRPGGWVILIWNERDDSDPFTAAYGAVVRSTPDAAAVEVPRGAAGDPLLSCPRFRDAQRVSFSHLQLLTEEQMLGRAFSASYAPREPGLAEAFAGQLQEVFRRFASDGKVVLRYQTSVYLARKPA